MSKIIDLCEGCKHDNTDHNCCVICEEGDNYEKPDSPKLPVDKIVMPAKLWELVKDLEEKYSSNSEHNDLAECKATMIVNFGNNGRTRPELIDDETGRLLPMLMTVFKFYEEKFREYEQV